MSSNILSRVSTDSGDYMVMTKIKYLGIFDRPRTSVMPYKAGSFVGQPGFQIAYNTSDPSILQEWHEMVVDVLTHGSFDFLCDGARVGYFPYPDKKNHLEQYVKSFI